MDDRRARRRGRWIGFWLVLIGVPVLAYFGYVLVGALVMSTFD
jgi:hypothetical protein